MSTVIERKSPDGYYEIIDEMDNLYHVIKADKDPNSAKKTGWNAYFVKDGISEEWITDYVTKRDAVNAIIRQCDTLLAEAKAHDDYEKSKSIKPKKLIMCTCEHCGIEYEAQRKSSRFCKPSHRAAWNKKQKRLAKIEAMSVKKQIEAICIQVYEKQSSRKAVIELSEIRELIDKYLSAGTRLWMCNTCGKQAYTFIPIDRDCACGFMNSEWYIAGTGKV